MVDRLLLYGSGLRLMECLNLRVKDLVFSRGEVDLLAGKRGRDRVTVLPSALVGPPVVVLGLGLLCALTPTHGFTATWAALAHAATVPGVRGLDVFTTVTGASWFMKPLRLPGLEGIAAWLLATVLGRSWFGTRESLT